MQTIVNVEPGWEVRGADDQKVGSVTEVGLGYVLVKQGMIFTKDVYVPLEAISGIDSVNGIVTLNIAKGGVENMSWSSPPEAPMPPIRGTEDEDEAIRLPPSNR